MSKAGNYIVAAAYFVAGYYTGNANFIQMGYLTLASAEVSRDRERKARNRARDAYNAGLQDRMVMLDLRPDAPRTLALGRVRAVEGVRRRWNSGANAEKLTMIVSFAGHEIDAFETFWFNDTPLELDGSGYVQTAPYLRTDGRSDTLSATADGSGAANVTLTSAPVGGTDVVAVYTYGTGQSQIQGSCTVTQVSGLDYTVTGAIAGATIDVSWQTSVATSSARIRAYLGTAAQNVGAALSAEYPGNLTSTDKFAGIALAVVDLWYSEDAFPQGIPNITATFRGAKCLDPRTSVTEWTENPALHAYHYARWANGWNVPSGKIRTQDVEDAADFCDTSTVFTLGVDDVTLPRYRCGIVISSDADTRQSMNAIMETMAGRWGWAGGTLRMRCGRMATPTWAMDESWIAQPLGAGGQAGSSPVVRISNGVPREEKINHVAGTCIDPDQRYQALPYPAVRDEVLITADGAEYRLDADMPGINHIAHAQHLASIVIREAQAPLRMEVMSNLSAYRCELFDVGEVTVNRYGMTDKTFEVIGWRWRPAEGVMLRLSEITDAIFTPVDTLNGRDPAPNGNLPSPWNVEQITGVSVASDVDVQPDGTVLTLTIVSWTAPTSQAILAGGRIEVQYTRADAVPAAGIDWASRIEQGGAVNSVIPGLLQDIFYLFRVRAINGLGVRGPWSRQVLWQISGDNIPPENVTNLDWEIKPGLVRITCDPCVAADYAATELRYLNTLPDYDSGDWAAATFLVRGKTNEYHHPRPPNGTYYVLAKHIDNSDNYSTTPAYITVVVDDSIDAPSAGSGRLVLRTNRFPFFQFPDGTSHTTSSPLLEITAIVIGLRGDVTWTATAYTSSDVAIGAVSLTGTGNTRTMSGAQFVAPGTSGSVYYVIVEAEIGTVNDSIVVFRADPTIAVARIYLSNPRATVPTDEQGLYGDYTDATTEVAVYEGVTLKTDDWSLAITPDAGVTAAINGGAGPVTGTTDVTLAVTDMTISDGVVLVDATKGADTLQATFSITKSEASGSGYNIYFTPRQEIVLPVDTAGNVLSYLEAWSDLKIIRAGQIDETALWSLTKVDTNVASTLTDARVQVAELRTLGALGTPASQAISFTGLGWTSSTRMLWGDDTYMILGTTGFGTNVGHVKTASDPAGPWTDRALGTAGVWKSGAYAGSAFVLAELEVGSTNRTLRSTNRGVSWSVVTLPASSQWYDIRAQGSTVLITSQTSTTACRSTDGGATYGTVTMPATSCYVYPGGGSRWFARSSAANSYVSNDNGSTWTNITSSLPDQLFGAIGYKGRSVVVLWDSGFSKAVYTEDGANFLTVTTPARANRAQMGIVSDVLYMIGDTGVLQYTVDGVRWQTASASPPAGTFPMVDGSLPLSYLPLLDASATRQVPLLSTSADTGFVTITATKAGQLPMTATLPVRKGLPAQDVYTFQANPGYLLLPATSDGVVTDWSGASITARANKNGADDSANWTWAWTATNMTPASGTGSTATFTAMSADSGQVTFRGSKAGQPEIVGTLNIAKAKGGIPSGPVVGGAFHVISATTTWVGLKFLGDGRFQVKRGSGGSYADAGQWAGAVLASNTSYWIRVSATGHSLDSGTVDTWLAMTSDREYVLSDVSSGTHTTNLTVLFATDNTGSNAVIGFGSMQLIVP